jgi:DNA mismatch repair protein MutS2
MLKKTIETLEYGKILNMLAKYVCCKKTRKLVLNLKPSFDSKKVKMYLEETDQALKIIKNFSSPEIYDLDSFEESLKRLLIGGVLSNLELLNVAKILKNSKILKKYYIENKEMLSQYFENIILCEDVEKKIFDCIISNSEISDSASYELMQIRQKIKNNEQKIKNFLNKILNSTHSKKFLQENLITLRNNRFVLPVKIEYKNEISGIVHDISSSGNTAFIEPTQIVLWNNKFKKLHAEEKNEIDKILLELTNLVFKNAEIIKTNYENILKIDLIFAKAKFALDIKACKPEINNSGKLNLKDARHPFLNSSEIVPLDIKLGYDFDVLIISGSNAGGKTVALKIIGLFCLMALTGLFLPASEKTIIPVFNNIFADIGDEQSIEQNLSTFSSHIKNIINITKYENKNSLILIDEICAGTDPTEGAALAISIIEFLKLKKNHIVVTTHYNELKIHAMSVTRTANGSFGFDDENNKPTYKFREGIPGCSNAFSISKKLGLSQIIVNNAKEKITVGKIKFEEILDEIDIVKNKIEDEKKIIYETKIEIEKLKNKTKQEEKETLEKAKNEALNMINSTKKEIEEILSEIKKQKDEKNYKNIIENFRKKLNLKIENMKIEKMTPCATLNINNLKVGLEVFVIHLNQNGKIVRINKKNNTINIQIGTINITTDISNVTYANKNSKKNSFSFIKSGKKINLKDAKYKLDLRGFSVEDALFYIEKFLDDAMLANLKTVTIIHGKGTGTLRKEIHNFLKNKSFIKEFRLGNFGEGDLGVTIVEIN